MDSIHLGIFVFSFLLSLALLMIFFTRKYQGQIFELHYQNRLLKALRNLDITAFSTNEIDKTCQGIVDVIREELGYFFGAIALVDDLAGGLRRIAISQSPSINTVLSKLSIPYKKQVVFLSEKRNFLIRVMDERKTLFTESLFDIQIGVYPQQTSDYLQKTLNMKGFFIYPIIAKNNVIGVIYYCTTIPKEKFSKFEFDIMDSFSRESARVLENVLLYQSLKLTSQKLAFANQKLKNIDQLKDDFVSVASHELRTPMTAIRSYVWMALHKSDIPLSQKLERYLYRTLVSTERLINLVGDMLNVSRIESGSIEINPKSFSILELVEDVMEEVKVKSDEKKLQLTVLQHSLPNVFADQDKVHEVLLNLAGNALKFTFPQGTVSVDFFTDGKVVEVAVKDNGAGIAREDLGRLFKKFGRLDSSYTSISASGGTGLGLYISKSLVELMHGKIWASSEGLGKGATFTFSLPIVSQEILSQAEKYHIKPTGEAKGLEPAAI